MSAELDTQDAQMAEAIRNSSIGTTEVVEIVLAAGYRKPRLVATLDELAGLPVDSVILTHKGGVFTKHFDHFREQDNWEARGAGSVWPEDLPATVLYQPEVTP